MGSLNLDSGLGTLKLFFLFSRDEKQFEVDQNILLVTAGKATTMRFWVFLMITAVVVLLFEVQSREAKAVAVEVDEPPVAEATRDQPMKVKLGAQMKEIDQIDKDGKTDSLIPWAVNWVESAVKMAIKG